MSDAAEESAVRPWAASLAVRAGALAFALSFGAGVVASALVWAQRVGRAAEIEEMVANDRSSLGSNEVETALAVGDLATLESIINALVVQPGAIRVRLLVDGARLVDRTLGPADEAGDAPMLAALEAQALASGRDAVARVRGVYFISSPIDAANGKTGVFTLGIDGGPAHASIPFLELALLLILLPATVGTAGYIATGKLADRLRTLSGFARSLAEEGFEKRLEVRQGEVLADVSASLNAMADRLLTSHRKLHKMAYSDMATGLPNHERFVWEVAECLRRRDDEICVMAVIRMERLDRIYDAFGQEAGDEILARIVTRLRTAIRSIDRLVRAPSGRTGASLVARLRGGEFGILAPDLVSNEEAGRYVQLLVGALNQAFEWRGNKLALNAFVGAALLPQDGDTPDTAIRHAMLALGAARTEASRLRFFSKALDREAAAQIQFERELRLAVERNEFRAYYQPKIDLMTGRLVGAEALARWIRPDRTMVSPGKFIPVAEEHGFIGAISEQILRDAIWKTAQWCREGHPLSIAINISPVQFADERFADKILKIMEEAGASPNHIELEITESMALENPDRAQRILEPLRSRGVKVALDDFGCGHSSLASLTRMPFDIIKIDQQFVRGLANDRHAPAIIETILAMAASLNYEVVAEGIETEREMEFLRRRGCMIGQGFLFGAAMPAPEFTAYAQDRSNQALNGLTGTDG